jgi:hypothetical protein
MKTLFKIESPIKDFKIDQVTVKITGRDTDTNEVKTLEGDWATPRTPK